MPGPFHLLLPTPVHSLIATLHARGALALLAAVLLLAGLAPQALAQTTYTVTVANKTAAHPYFGQGHPTAYRIDGAEAPAVTLVRGQTYTFQMSNVGAVHPFYLSTSASGSSAGVYTDGVTGNFATGNATLTFTVPASAPDELWYQCSNHDFMGWRMNVVSGGAPYAAVLSGANEAPTANTSAATGTVTATLTGTTLVVGGGFSGLSGAYTVSHLHLGLAGQAGAVQFALTPTVAADGRSGTFEAAANTFTLTAVQAEALAARRIYANVHSTARPGGEIRGQFAPAAATPYRALVRAAEEVPANGSTATGTLAADLDGTTLTVTGSFAGLSAAYTVSHLHLGLTGQSGAVQFALTPTVAADGRSGTFEAAANTFTLTAAQAEALAARRIYANVHSTARPGGEIRGQVSPASWFALRAALTGRAEVPAANPSQASGGVLVEVRGLQAVASGSFAGLGSNFNTAVGAHLHLGALGVNGPVVFPLTVALGADNRSGTIERAANTFTLTQAQADAFVAGGYYVNVHSVDRPAGEVRGQAVPIATRTVEAWLVGANEVGPVATTATGGLVGVLDGLTLTVAGSFAGLTSDFNTAVGAHLHLAPAGQNGPVVFPLAVALGADNRSGSFAAASNVFALTSAQAAAFAGGGYYANIHSVDRPSGEIRGQLLATTNLAPSAPALTAPADGATVVLEGASSAPFVVTWSAGDPNANPLAHTWQLARDAAFADVVLTSASLAEARFETTVGAVDELLASIGVAPGQSATLFHRARSRDGSFGASSVPFTITLRRGVVVAGESPAGPAGAFAVGRTAPNPFSGATTLTLDLPEAATVTVEVFDAIGRRMLQVDAGELPAGRGQAVRLDGSSLAAGLYVYRVRADGAARDYSATGRMVRAE